MRIMQRVRRAAVAGLFYPSDPDELRESIRSSFTGPLGPGRLPPVKSSKIFGMMVPHAGYEYSAQVAAHGYLEASAVDAELFVIIGPNHYGIGSGVAVPASELWNTPLGDAEIDVGLARALVDEGSIVDMDDGAHWREHSIEVQVPFLQYLRGGVKILPISMAMMDEGTTLELADLLYRKLEGRRFFVIASSDMTHYEDKAKVAQKDERAIRAILSLDVSELYRVLEKYNITMCGYGAAAVLMHLSKRFGAGDVRLLKHADSGDTTGDNSSVVGYATLGFYHNEQGA